MATRVGTGWLEGARGRREVEDEDGGKEFAEGGSWGWSWRPIMNENREGGAVVPDKSSGNRGRSRWEEGDETFTEDEDRSWRRVLERDREVERSRLINQTGTAEGAGERREVKRPCKREGYNGGGERSRKSGGGTELAPKGRTQKRRRSWRPKC